MDTIVGIDLGTTNSEVAYIRDGQPHVFAEDDDPILPSFVGLSDDGRLLVGKPAKNQWVLAPERTIKSIKRKMGQDVKVRLGDHEYRPQEISAMILKALKERAERQLGAEVKKAVITVPAYFNDAQGQATKEAGELAGLDVVRILNEPTAASLTYDPSQREMRRMLVYDLGGGTWSRSCPATATPSSAATTSTTCSSSTSATASSKSTASTCGPTSSPGRACSAPPRRPNANCRSTRLCGSRRSSSPKKTARRCT